MAVCTCSRPSRLKSPHDGLFVALEHELEIVETGPDTHVYDANDPHIAEDAIVGVKPELIVDFDCASTIALSR